MNGKRVKAVIQKAIREIQDNEEECYRKMAYMNEHKFELEREAIRYRQQAFNRSWLIVSSALDEINKLED